MTKGESMEPLFESEDIVENQGKHDRKNKIETERRIRELKEQYRLKKELDYYEFDDYDE